MVFLSDRLNIVYWIKNLREELVMFLMYLTGKSLLLILAKISLPLALLLKFVAEIVHGFEVTGMGTAVLGALIISFGFVSFAGRIGAVFPDVPGRCCGSEMVGDAPFTKPVQ